MRFFWNTLKMAVHALRRNVLRSALTTLLISIGVSAVIALAMIGKGASRDVQKRIESMGANNLLIFPGTASSGGVNFGSGSVLTLTPSDSEAIAERCQPYVTDVAPIVRVRTQVVYGNRNWVPIYVYGTTPSFLEIRDWQDLDAGENFTDQDVRNASQVCLLGKTVTRELFGVESPIGKEIRINNKVFRVVGVLSYKGANMMGSDQDDVVLAPWKTIKYKVANQSLGNVNQSAIVKQDASQQVNTTSLLYPSQQTGLYPIPSAIQMADTPLPVRFTNVDQILAQAESSEAIDDAMREIVAVLRERHRLAPAQPDDFYIRDMTEMNNALGSVTERMSTFMVIVALISLIVGGVGIMTIMLVSVMERTREIGLRMAVGARARDILLQFLVEAVFLCVLGGVIGIIVGVGVALLFHFSPLHWPIGFSLPTVITAFVVSGAVGVIFGWYPAWKASRLDPIEALRYE